MGAGKTTVGLLLADRLQREFVDVDHEIEKRHGMPVTEIFKTLGEPAFRNIEREFIVDRCKAAKRQIVSLGGGAFMQEPVRDVCLNGSIVFYLEITWERWKDRVQLIKDTRPMLQQRTMEEIEQLFHARHAVYSLSHYCIRTDGSTPEEIADAIIRTFASIAE